MDIYRPKAIVSKYYTILFTLPNWQILAAILMATGLVVVLSMGKYALLILLNSLLVFVTLHVYSKIFKQSVFHKIKRLIGMSLAILVYTSIFSLLTNKVLVAIVSSVTMLAVVVMGLDGTSSLRITIPTAPPCITLLVAYFLGYYTIFQVVVGLLLVFALVFLDLLIYSFMSRRKIDHYSLPDLGTLFLRNWLDRRTDIEKAFDQIGEIQYVNPRIIELGDLALIYTDVHYGPFSNIGSSRLPIVLTDAFKKIGYRNILTLHGLGSHDRNIASSYYTSKYVEELVKSLVSNDGKRLLYKGAFSVKNSDWQLIGIVFDKLSFIVVSRPGKGIDDLPYGIQLEYELKARNRGLGDIVILDAHNWELQEEPDLDDLRKLLDITLGKIEEYQKREPVEVLYRYKCFESNAPGLVSGYGCIVCISGENREEACILYLRGNNMKPGARDSLLKAMKNIGTAYVEVITNDEHSETGTRAHIAYIPVHDSRDLVRDVENASMEIRNIKPLTGARIYNCRMNLKLMGNSVDLIKKQLSPSLRESSVLLLFYVFGTPLILSFLI
ncbi:MAG: DUF2070 family protein [Desulfurococcaceae archaeon]